MFSVLPTFLCNDCGWIGGVNEANQIRCNNPKCPMYGRLFTIDIIAHEVEAKVV